MIDRILPEPVSGDWWHTCPHCGTRYALTLIHEYDDPIGGRIRCYRCEDCGRKVDYAESRPDHCV